MNIELIHDLNNGHERSIHKAVSMLGHSPEKINDAELTTRDKKETFNPCQVLNINCVLTAQNPSFTWTCFSISSVLCPFVLFLFLFFSPALEHLCWHFCGCVRKHKEEGKPRKMFLRCKWPSNLEKIERFLKFRHSLVAHGRGENLCCYRWLKLLFADFWFGQIVI